MQLENYVINELENKGYPVFFRNLRIECNKIQVTEYDVVSRDFIIEVKSGKDLSLKSSQPIKHLRFLPLGYKLYYYCPCKSDEDIKMMNHAYNIEGGIIFINSLEEIYKNHKPYNEVNIKTQKDFTRFLSLSFDKLKIFDKVNVDKETFYYTYLCLNYINDYYSKNDMNPILSSEKIRYLVDNKKINMVENFDKNVATLSTKNPNQTIIITMDQILSGYKLHNLCKYYYLGWNKNKLENIDVNSDLPLFEGITKWCGCNRRIIFYKQEDCSKCSMNM